ncbi:hypothetical protein [Streptomyces sp. N35]|uniref:hypothetical protein n=1 Tax=Streptomyces sp. N35 TaxID=2795730 RepID=UPI0018F51D3D|nr:hypothetical protein [Streptomyces sp. N35]
MATLTAIATGPDPEPAGRLIRQLHTVLDEAGLPIARTGDRTVATGVLVAGLGDQAVVEWLVSVELRSKGAAEQVEGNGDGPASRQHAHTRHVMHATLRSLLVHAGSIVHDAGDTLEISATDSAKSSGQPGFDLPADSTDRMAPLRKAPSPMRGFLIDEDDN